MNVSCNVVFYSYHQHSTRSLPHGSALKLKSTRKSNSFPEVLSAADVMYDGRSLSRSLSSSADHVSTSVSLECQTRTV